MTGRARGRSRGRGRTTEAPSSGEARRPGEPAVRPPEQAQVGRGRSRGPQADAVAQQRPPVQQMQQTPSPPTEQMRQMTVGDTGGSSAPAPRSNRYSERVLREPGKDIRGTSGKPINIMTNSFALETSPDFMIYQYQVTFNPEIDFKKARIGLVNAQTDLIGNIKAFDGQILFLPRKLPNTETRIQAIRNRKNSPPEPVEIIFKLTNELPKESPSLMQVFNIIFRRVLKQNEMKQVGRQYYNLNGAVSITRHQLEVWPGFATSILRYDHGILLGADVSHKVLRTETVYDMLLKLHDNEPRTFHETAQRKLVGQIVITRYNNKTYMIHDISWDEHPSDTFETKQGPRSYMEYYEQQYERSITDQTQPLLVHKPKMIPGKPHIEKIMLIPEFCFLTGLSDDMRNNFTLMKDLAVHTRIDPKDRCRQLTDFLQKINGNAESANELSGWRLKFSRDLVSFQGRVLPPETINTRGRKCNYNPASADWSKETRGSAHVTTVNLQHWSIIFTRRDSGHAESFYNNLVKVSGPMGISVSKPVQHCIENDRTEQYLKVLKQLPENTQIVVCIVPSNRKDRYDAIKKACCFEIDNPVPSQVIVSKTLNKPPMLMSVCTKICIQLNVKLGGEAWAVEIPLKNMMVVGIDCYHDSSQKGRSVGGFVASINQTLTRYYSKCTFQHTQQELVDGLKTCMTAALRKYNEVNKTLPDRIVIYRDGVGDGQLNYVLDHELRQMMESFQSISSGTPYRPKFGMVIVKKRIQTRLFEQARNGLSNPPPGTVCDTNVTRPEWSDFYLVSQSVRQGTVSPTHYNVIYDTTGLKPDHIQRLSYKLTHLYYNWPGTVRVPAPCQYAHKLAFLVGQSLHRAPAATLEDKLFFL